MAFFEKPESKRMIGLARAVAVRIQFGSVQHGRGSVIC